mmetsp:Transcript_19785/g.33940  ORF Transcript_19785/g.33940 Transcript_19785/m.33940 type:complete len:106 (-) Transcript_19785:755-1072(-)
MNLLPTSEIPRLSSCRSWQNQQLSLSLHSNINMGGKATRRLLLELRNNGFCSEKFRNLFTRRFTAESRKPDRDKECILDRASSDILESGNFGDQNGRRVMIKKVW